MCVGGGENLGIGFSKYKVLVCYIFGLFYEYFEGVCERGYKR